MGEWLDQMPGIMLRGIFTDDAFTRRPPRCASRHRAYFVPAFARASTTMPGVSNSGRMTGSAWPGA